MRLTTLIAAGSLATLGVLSSGCSSTQRGAAVGAGVGAGTGAIIAHNTGAVLSQGEAALVGAATGGLVGALAGDGYDLATKKDNTDELRVRNAALEGQLQGKDRDLDSMKGELDRLRAELASKPAVEPQVQIETKDGTIRFTILNEVLYDAGKAELKKEGLTTLDGVMEIVQKEYPDRRLVIEGHTDSDPIKYSNWKSNWELSFARSLAVVQYLMADKGIPGAKLQATACAEYKPVTANDTAENKRQNRRAVIVVMPADSNIVMDRK